MKLAVTADLHLKHWYGAHNLDKPDRTVMESLEQEKPDLWIDCGDMEVPEFFAAYKGDKLFIPGNHDYYGRDWDNWAVGCTARIQNGYRIVGATLWTDFNKNDSSTKNIVRHTLADYEYIRYFTPDICYEVHKEHLRWLSLHGKGADVIFTHHCPSLQSCHEKYRSPIRNVDLMNYGFASELEDLVEFLAPKFWFHGHTHDNHDYSIGNTRVICHPCGYPHENKQAYIPRYFDV